MGFALSFIVSEQDRPLKGLAKEDLTNQVLIKALRKELGMTFNDYYMVLTDIDMKAKVSACF